ncbi:hypothetical protein [Dinghuibacter silviterrae]|uniref:YXWGXW repeat-containing protein n=1 Tax=Dinghuibacter silviterrae TaxID=1539049 RepID=A0A4R8DH10_9BACT|nr:hypothetical protein [Dinghuibacter silviterrae]TDW96688.1 hypothetical protein EDB95_4524 [Dinghuibacter silviterrae]
MKGIFVAALLTGGFFTAHAQVQFSVNIGLQPSWGPVGYSHVEYYYMPDIDAYYCVPRHQYVYMDGGQWVFAPALPRRFGGYDVYRGYKVVINDPEPYRHCDEYRERYRRYRGCYGQQVVIRDHHHEEGREDEYDHHWEGDDHPHGHAWGHYKHDRGDD